MTPAPTYLAELSLTVPRTICYIFNPASTCTANVELLIVLARMPCRVGFQFGPCVLLLQYSSFVAGWLATRAVALLPHEMAW
jgi:hypothetical protein